MVTCITDARMATLTRRERLRELGVMTASGTGTGTGIQPWIWVQCSPIPARRIFLCYGWDSGQIWPFKPSPDVRMKVETVDWHLKALFLFFSVFTSIFIPTVYSLLCRDSLTVIHMKRTKITGYAWLSPATA